MMLGALISGGKDSLYAAYIASKYHEVCCLISIISENPFSYMFHTPSITSVKKQAKVMDIPLIIQKTKGKKESELKDLKTAISKAKEKYKIKGIVSGAVESIYQATRIQKICNSLKLEVFNPLWQKDQFELLEEIIKNKFEAIITGVFAYPLDKSWLGRKINREFIKDIKTLQKKYGINPAGEGGEFETLVLDCPLFKKKLKIKNKKIFGNKNTYFMEVTL